MLLSTAPPEQVDELVVEASTATAATIKWLPPPDTGRTDTTYTVCATNLTGDLLIVCYDPILTLVKDEQGNAIYELTNLAAFSTYSVTVTVRNGVSNQDDKPVIPAESYVYTEEGGT